MLGEWGRLACSTEACKHGRPESIDPVPWAWFHYQLFRRNGHWTPLGSKGFAGILYFHRVVFWSWIWHRPNLRFTRIRARKLATC